MIYDIRNFQFYIFNFQLTVYITKRQNAPLYGIHNFRLSVFNFQLVIA